MAQKSIEIMNLKQIIQLKISQNQLSPRQSLEEFFSIKNGCVINIVWTSHSMIFHSNPKGRNH